MWTCHLADVALTDSPLDGRTNQAEAEKAAGVNVGEFGGREQDLFLTLNPDPEADPLPAREDLGDFLGLSALPNSEALEKVREERAAMRVREEERKAGRLARRQEAKAGPFFRAGVLSRKERLGLRRAALELGKRSSFQIGEADGSRAAQNPRV